MTTDAMTYATDIDSRLQELFAALQKKQDQPTDLKTDQDLEDLELEVRALVVEIGDLVVAQKVQACLNEENFRNECRDFVRQCRKSLVYKGLREVSIRFAGGTVVRMSVPYWARKGRAGRRGKGLYPGLYLLGIHDNISPLLASDISQASAALCSFEEAQTMLANRGCLLNIKVVRKVAKRFASRARLGKQVEGLPLTEEDRVQGRRIVISTDGGRLRTRKNKKGRRTKKGRHRYHSHWREPKLIIIYAAGEDGRMDRHFLPLVDASLGGPDATYALLYSYLKVLQISAADALLFVADGATWIWERVRLLVKLLSLAGLPCTIIELIDFYHAAQHLHDFANHRRGWNERQRKRWVSQQKRRLKRGEIGAVITAMRQAMKGTRNKRLRRELGYFTKNRSRFAYDKVAAAGLPIGSGAVESAIRRVVNLRLKGPCTFWTEETAEEMLLLRAYYKVGRWTQIKTMAYRGGLAQAA